MRLCGVLMTAAAIALIGIAATPRPAHACSCIHRELSEYADDISVAFVGRQLERVVHNQVGDNGAALLFLVDRVYKGEAGPLIEVRTHAQGPACGMDLGGMGAVGIAARTWRGDLSVSLCGSMVTAAELQDVLGEGHPPDVSIRLPDSDDDQGLLAFLLIAGAAAVLAAGAVAWHRRRQNWSRGAPNGNGP